MIEKKRIMLLITENCNLNCVYCYEHNKNSKTMDFDTAKRILDKNLRKIPSGNTVIIELFGGEAFANFQLIKEIESYIQKNYSFINVLYETTTNGTLVHGEIQEWLKKHKDKFLLSLSLDGTEKIHNLNRIAKDGRGSFELIDIPFFAETWKGCSAKMTVSKYTMPYLAEGIIFLEEQGFKCDTTLSVGVDWDYEKLSGIFIGELCKLVEHYTKNTTLALCTMLNMDLRLIFSPTEDYRFCGAGLEMTCYDTLGNEYPCQGFAPVSIGDESSKYRNFKQEKFQLADQTKCKNCMWVRLCPNCYAANLQSTGNIHKVEENLCRFYKLCILASAKIQGIRIMGKELYTNDDKLVLKAIQVIQEKIGKEIC